MNNVPLLSSLTYVGFKITWVLQEGTFYRISNDEISNAIRRGQLFEILDEKYPNVHFFPSSDKNYPENLNVINTISKYAELHDGSDGLLVLNACVLEAIQQMKWRSSGT